jgi:hypothetical protein
MPHDTHDSTASFRAPHIRSARMPCTHRVEGGTDVHVGRNFSTRRLIAAALQPQSWVTRLGRVELFVRRNVWRPEGALHVQGRGSGMADTVQQCELLAELSTRVLAHHGWAGRNPCLMLTTTPYVFHLLELSRYHPYTRRCSITPQHREDDPNPVLLSAKTLLAPASQPAWLLPECRLPLSHALGAGPEPRPLGAGTSTPAKSKLWGLFKAVAIRL